MNPLDITIHQEDERGNVYALRQELRYQDLIVPIGYESDGASVPRFFWRYGSQYYQLSHQEDIRKP